MQFRVIVVTDPQTNKPTNKPTDRNDYNTLFCSFASAQCKYWLLVCLYFNVVWLENSLGMAYIAENLKPTLFT